MKGKVKKENKNIKSKGWSVQEALRHVSASATYFQLMWKSFPNVVRQPYFRFLGFRI